MELGRNERECVACLDDLLDHAKNGRISSLSVVMVMNNTIIPLMTGNVDHMFAMNVGLDELKLRIVEHNRKGRFSGAGK